MINQNVFGRKLILERDDRLLSEITLRSARFIIEVKDVA